MVQIIRTIPSPLKNRKLRAILDDHNYIDFGYCGGICYLDHHDKVKRENYLKRHAKNENWNNPMSRGALSKWLLWGNSTSLNENIKEFKQKFDC